ncbi:MAG: hypothetical protein AUI14_02185 [Actinobacteria bacterium 13_2_20CM_2_71_6]|nr:MAG: hypothetical protein AUI14_02185 [Actinobacteria bacterium 13_2_20CM_2_71_6]
MGYRTDGISGGGAFDKTRRAAARMRVELDRDLTVRPVPEEPVMEPDRAGPGTAAERPDPRSPD